MKIAIIACSNKKRDVTCHARDMYQGQLFKFSVEYAESWGMPWYIISAKYGIIHPDKMIDPYNERVPTKAADITPWSNTRNYEAYCVPPKGMDKTFVLLCGKDYKQAFRDGINKSACPREFTCEEPLAGLGIGEQMKWLKENRRGVEASVAAG